MPDGGYSRAQPPQRGFSSKRCTSLRPRGLDQRRPFARSHTSGHSWRLVEYDFGRSAIEASMGKIQFWRGGCDRRGFARLCALALSLLPDLLPVATTSSRSSLCPVSVYKAGHHGSRKRLTGLRIVDRIVVSSRTSNPGIAKDSFASLSNSGIQNGPFAFAPTERPMTNSASSFLNRGVRGSLGGRLSRRRAFTSPLFLESRGYTSVAKTWHRWVGYCGSRRGGVSGVVNERHSEALRWAVYGQFPVL